MSKLGNTPHIKLFIDTDGQLYIYDQESKEKKLISMRQNRDGSKTSRNTAAEIEDAIWEFRWDHKDVVTPSKADASSQLEAPAG